MQRIRGRKWSSRVGDGGLIPPLSCPATRLCEREQGSPPGEKCSLSEQHLATDGQLLPNANKQSSQPGSFRTAVPFVILRRGGVCLKDRLLCLQLLISNMSASEEKGSVKYNKLLR